MKEIFTDLYKKVLGFFQSQEQGQEKENAKDVAVNRMKLVLMQDRTNLTPFLLEKMRGEMIAVLAKYVEMDQDALELNFEQEGEQMALMLSIPVIRAKEEEEIQAALDAEEAEQEKTEDEDEDEETEEIESEETAETDVDTEETVESSEQEETKDDTEHPHQDAIEIIEEVLDKHAKKKKK